MYKKNIFKKSTIFCNESVEGETLEDMIKRLKNNKETISEEKEMTYTDRGDGVMASTDVRTDKWDVAIEARDKIDAYETLKYGNFDPEKREWDKENNKDIDIVKDESTQATNNTDNQKDN